MPEFIEPEALPLLLTVKDVQRLIRISRPTIYKMIDDGRLMRKKIGRATRITRESVLAMLAGLPAA